MHAVQIQQAGGPEVLQWTEVDDPVAGQGQVLVELAAAGLNYIDTYHRGGLYPMPMPLVPGVEGAGTVIALGDGVEETHVLVVNRRTDSERAVGLTHQLEPARF